MQVTINIDREVLDAAYEERDNHTWRSESCPIALDLKRQGMWRVTVARKWTRFIDRRGVKRQFEHSDAAREFILRADISTERGCDPTTFDLGTEVRP